MVTSTKAQDTLYNNREKLKCIPVRPPERPKLQPIIIHGFRVTTNTDHDMLYKIHEKMKHYLVRLPERPKLQPIIHGFRYFVAAGKK
ncbi:hypothetical protein KSS87_016102 [Heliosperma pusillum]|nr:hypothetical protein KSS87_016102 [Heliosperma pusillum]